MTPTWAFALFALQAPAAAEQRPPACVGFHFVYFATGSTVIDGNAARIIDNFVDLLGRSVVPSRVRVTGYADRVGSPNANLDLSRLRANTVRRYLHARGVTPARVDVAAMGENAPIIETSDETAEAQNRFVLLQELIDPAEAQRREAVWARIGRPQIVC